MDTNITESNNTETPKDYKEIRAFQLEAKGINLGQFMPYDSKATDIPDINNTRAVKCTYKYAQGTPEHKKTHANSYVLIPTDHINKDIIKENFDKLADYFEEFLWQQQDEIIKKAHKDNESQIFTEYLTLDKLLSHMHNKGLGTRLSGDKIAAWYDSNIKDTIYIMVCNKLGIDSEPTDAQATKIQLVIKTYLDLFKSCAGSRTHLTEEQRESLKNVINMADQSTSQVGTKILGRLDDMVQGEKDAFMAL